MKHFILSCLFFLLLFESQAKELPFQTGEELTFDIHYKYGLVMLKAGSANYKLVESSYNDKHSYLSTIDFKTSSFFDKIFKMRDTLSSYMAENLLPLYHIRSVHEGNYHFREEMFINKFSTNHSEIHLIRKSGEILRFDTILTANTAIYDMLNLIHLIRSFDYSDVESRQAKNITVFVGRDRIPVIVRYEGQSVVEKNETLKYKTYKIALDFADEAFTESKSAIEVWVSDDKNHIPIKIKAKLRIGAAEVYLSSWKNLKHPFDSEIKIPVRKNIE